MRRWAKGGSLDETATPKFSLKQASSPDRPLDSGSYCSHYRDCSQIYILNGLQSAPSWVALTCSRYWAGGGGWWV